MTALQQQEFTREQPLERDRADLAAHFARLASRGVDNQDAGLPDELDQVDPTAAFAYAADQLHDLAQTTKAMVKDGASALDQIETMNSRIEARIARNQAALDALVVGQVDE